MCSRRTRRGRWISRSAANDNKYPSIIIDNMARTSYEIDGWALLPEITGGNSWPYLLMLFLHVLDFYA